MTSLVFEDAQGYADFGTFVARARAVDAEGAMRLQAEGTILAAFVGVLPGRGLLGDGAVVGLRTMRLGAAVSIDRTVSLASLTDRVARGRVATDPRLDVPTATVQVPWAALTPPRSGWEPVGALQAAALEEAARIGIAEVANGTAPGAGAHAVTDLRLRVWARLTETVPAVPAGAAFAAYALGFLDRQSPCTVAAHGRWTRLSSPRGHVVVR